MFNEPYSVFLCGTIPHKSIPQKTIPYVGQSHKRQSHGNVILCPFLSVYIHAYTIIYIHVYTIVYIHAYTIYMHTRIYCIHVYTFLCTYKL